MEASSDTIHLGASFDGSDLILTTLIEHYYTFEPVNLILTAFDSDYTDTTNIDIYIDPVNDAPVLAEIGNQSTDEDTPLELTLYATDVESDNLTFSALSSNEETVTVAVDDTTLTLTPADNWFGTVNITVTVTDDVNLSNLTVRHSC